MSIVKKTTAEVKKSEPQKIKREPNSSFILYKDKILKIQDETTKGYSGFDIFTEKPFFIRKCQNAIELPEVVIKLIGCDKSRLQLANAMCKNRKDVSVMLNMVERTLYRLYSKHKLIMDDRKPINKKITDGKKK